MFLYQGNYLIIVTVNNLKTPLCKKFLSVIIPFFEIEKNPPYLDLKVYSNIELYLTLIWLKKKGFQSLQARTTIILSTTTVLEVLNVLSESETFSVVKRYEHSPNPLWYQVRQYTQLIPLYFFLGLLSLHNPLNFMSIRIWWKQSQSFWVLLFINTITLRFTTYLLILVVLKTLATKLNINVREGEVWNKHSRDCFITKN